MMGKASESERKFGASDQWLTTGRFAVILGLLVFATFPGVLLGSTTFIIRDFGLFGYPLAYYHRQSFWRGELPLWNPLSSCGLPFLAQWNTLTLYPFSLIYLLLPLSWSLSFFCLAHQFWGGLGMYILARRWSEHRLAAALAGLIFAFNGLTLNALMWPNIVATLGWLPWVIWLGQRAWRQGGRALVWGALAGAMQMLAGGPEPILLTWLILFALVCGSWIHERELRSKLVWRFLGMGLLVALICAAQLLPFLVLLARSQRDAGFGSSDWSMPIWGWANFLVPLFRASPTRPGLFFQPGQYWTSSYYAGIGTVLLVVVAVWRVRDWRVRFMAVLLLLGLLLALGDGGLLYRGLRACVPGIGFIRFPVKFVILILALAPPLAAFGFAALAAKPAPAGRFELGVVVAMLLLIGMLVWLSSREPGAEDAWRATWQNGLTRAAFLALVVLFALACLYATGIRRVLLGCCLLLIFWLDFVTHMPAQNPSVQRSVYTPGWASAHLKLNPRPSLGHSRLMIAPLSEQAIRTKAIPSLDENYLLCRLAFFDDCNLLEEIPQAHGLFSLTPAPVNNVTVLPFLQTDHEFPALLDFMGVSLVTASGKISDWAPRRSAMPLVTAGQRPVFADDHIVFQAFYQTNLDLRQIVFLPPEARGAISATQQTTARVLDTVFENHRVSIRAEASAPSLILLAQSYYPAWRAYVDGHPTQIWRANYAFQAVQIPAGQHNVRLVYRDQAFRFGVALSGLGLLICAGLWLSCNAQQRFSRSPVPGSLTS
jgi:hypothetical protein